MVAFELKEEEEMALRFAWIVFMVCCSCRQPNWVLRRRRADYMQVQFFCCLEQLPSRRREDEVVLDT
ncbi:unnamed protein product [Enterobius vermicularis]|uniref:Secreted protein n=1 Tax=Enterobius vermicularis TaxID=51028 RepID=A0A0N4V2B9_ENTVE|nr:unnamed protein product [Enterobius vermicularis]